MKHIIHILTILLLLAVVAACSGTPTTQEAPEPTAAPVADAPTEVVEPTAAEPDENAESPAAEEAAAGECDEGFRLFDHEILATDPVCIPENPERVAFIGRTLNLGLALGVDSVVFDLYVERLVEDFPDAIDEADLANMIDIGWPGEPNLEVLLQADPDLIISNAQWDELNENASEIAPTISLEITTNWRDGLDAIAQASGRSAEAEAVLSEIDMRLATLRELIGNEDLTYTLVRTTDETAALQIFTNVTVGAQQAEGIGLSMPDTILTPEEAVGMPSGEASNYLLSVENLDDINADHVFVMQGWEADVQDEFLMNPLWQNLEAVQNDNVHLVGGGYWQQFHPIAIHRVIDDLFRFVADVDSQEVSPNPFAYTYKETEK